MKYLNEYRDPALAKHLLASINKAINPKKTYHLMEFCGGHTHAIFRYGIPELLPENIQLIHGPGCPVCVLPAARIESAIELLHSHDVILCTYADLMRVPTNKRNSLLKEKARGADIRMVYSTQDALQVAKENPEREVVFFAIGFETTTPATAIALKIAKERQLNNFSVFCNHVLTPAALSAILSDKNVSLNGILGPSHVSTIIGSAAYESFSAQNKIPIVIAGFEPLDILQSILMLIKQINKGQCKLENEYTRAVTRDGNLIAQSVVDETMEIRDSFEWRGLGPVLKSALKIRPEYSDYDCEKRFDMKNTAVAEQKGCECPSVIRGVKRPTDCKLFAKVCRPDNPLGACMVSSEGACAAYWSYSRNRLPETVRGEIA